MKTLSDEFREIRRVATPFCVIQTTDYRVTVKELLKVRYNGEETPPSAIWDCVNGAVSIHGDIALPAGDAAEVPPSAVLKAAIGAMPDESILFWVVPDDFGGQNHFWTNPFTCQAVANLRDEFKANRRTLVILSIDGKLPSLIADDVPLLKDPLPDEDALVHLAEELVMEINEKLADANRKPMKVAPSDITKAGRMCRGMNRFAAEEALSRNLHQKTGLDLENLSQAQRLVIEQSSERVLTFERGTETFDDIGGLDQIKKFSKRLFSGNNPPSLIVRIEEIEKVMAGSDSEAGDTSGVSQDQLGIMLQRMEDNDWAGFIAYGVPGGGKSLVSKAMGNSNGVITLNLDLGGAKDKWLGSSEQRIRKAMDIIFSVGGRNVFFVATANGLRVIPQALRRRFRFGVYAFGTPSREERKAIWSINLKKYGIDADQERPDDTDFVGSDIRNVCDLAYRLNCPLTEAVEYIVPVVKSDPAAVARFQDEAHGKFLDASRPGVYLKPETKSGRKIAV